LFDFNRTVLVLKVESHIGDSSSDLKLTLFASWAHYWKDALSISVFGTGLW